MNGLTVDRIGIDRRDGTERMLYLKVYPIYEDKENAKSIWGKHIK